jgi:hypothetical protein
VGGVLAFKRSLKTAGPGIWVRRSAFYLPPGDLEWGNATIGNSIRYSFVQHFAVPASVAYKWATNYDPEDVSLMGDRGKRRIKWITDDAVILSDTFERGNKKVKKTKLVRLSPERMGWTSTHISGPNKYSQFAYQISSDGDQTSHLEFIGSHIEYAEKKMPSGVIASLTSRILKEDSGTWKLLAKAMEEDVGRSH